MSTPDRPHKFVTTEDQKVIFCTQCGHVALNRAVSTESAANVDAQRVAKQPCPRVKP